MVRHVAGDKIGYDQGHLGGILGQLNYAQDKVWKF